MSAGIIFGWVCTALIAYIGGYTHGFQKMWMKHAAIMDRIQTVTLKPGAREELLKGLP